MKRLITAGAMRQWRPRLEEVNREVRQFGVALPGGVEHVGLGARALHEVGNWVVVTDCSNADDSVKSTVVQADVANCVPAISRLVVRCYGTRPADVGFWVPSKKTKTIAYSSGVEQGGSMGFRQGLKRFRKEFDGEGVDGFAYMDDNFLGLVGVTASTFRAFAFCRARSGRYQRRCGQPHQDDGIATDRERGGSFSPGKR